MASFAATPPVDGSEAKTESALKANIRSKGTNSYYYAHAKTNPEEQRCFGGAPRRLSTASGAEAGAAGAGAAGAGATAALAPGAAAAAAAAELGLPTAIGGAAPTATVSSATKQAPKPERITKYAHCDGKKTMKIYVTLDGSAALPDEAFSTEHGKYGRTVTLTVSGLNGADHALRIDKLHQEIRAVKLKRKGDRVTLTLRKVVECSWWRLRDTD